MKTHQVTQQPVTLATGCCQMDTLQSLTPLHARAFLPRVEGDPVERLKIVVEVLLGNPGGAQDLERLVFLPLRRGGLGPLPLSALLSELASSPSNLQQQSIRTTPSCVVTHR